MMYTCVRCGKQFEAKHKTAVCQDCHTAICVVCGKEFKLISPYTQKTCSPKCRGIYRKESGIAKRTAEKVKQTMLERYGVTNARNLNNFRAVRKCKYCGREFVATTSNQRYCNDVHYGPCPVCGKPVVIKDMMIGPQACSEACRQARIAQTNLEKYGTKCVFEAEAIKQKSRDTCKAKYGVEYYSQTSECQEHYKQTCLERYGVTSPMQNSDIKAKARATNIERYGGASPMCSDEIKAKSAATAQANYGGFGMASEILKARIQATNLEKYGSTSPVASPEVQAKMRSTNLERYGVENPMQNSEIRDKAAATSNERYGVLHPSQAPEIKDKVRATIQRNYRVDNVFQSGEIKTKIAETNLKRYGVVNPNQNSELFQKARQTSKERYGTEWYNSSRARLLVTMTDASKVDEFEEFKQDVVAYIQSHYTDIPTLNRMAQDTGVDMATVSTYIAQQGAQNYVKYYASTMEDDVIHFIRQLDDSVVIEQHNRSIIAPLEIDIYLPQFKLGIECNPTCTHNSSILDPWAVLRRLTTIIKLNLN